MVRVAGLPDTATPDDALRIAFLSPDISGILWKAASLSDTISGWYSVTYGNGKFVAVDTQYAAYSMDGINWAAATLPSSTNWNSVTYGNGRFVAVAQNAYVAYSGTYNPQGTTAAMAAAIKEGVNEV